MYSRKKIPKRCVESIAGKVMPSFESTSSYGSGGQRGHVWLRMGWRGKETEKKQTGKDGVKKKREFFSRRICLVRDEYDVSHIVNDAP